MNGTRTFQQVADQILASMNQALFIDRVHVAGFHQVWLEAGSPESWFQGNTGLRR